MGELRGRGGDRDPNQPDREPVLEPRPDRRTPEPEEPLPNWADRYPLEMRRQLATDPTIAILHDAEPRKPTEPAPNREQPVTKPDSTEPPKQDGSHHDERDAADAVREPPTDPAGTWPPPPVRERMANNSVFARDGWGTDGHDARDTDRPSRAQPTVPAGLEPQSRSSLREEQPTPPLPVQKPTDDVEARSPNAEHNRTDDAARDRRTEPEDRKPPNPPDTARQTDDSVSDRADAPPAKDTGEGRDANGADAPEHEFVEDADDPRAMDAYRRIREQDDLDAVAANSGFPREVVEVAKDNLFIRQHDVAVEPGVVRHGYFTPETAYSDLWDRAASGAALTGEERVQFWSLLAHEYVEAKLMQAGLPYKSAEPDAWNEYGVSKVEPEHPSAHNVAPKSMQSTVKDLLGHWKKLEIPRSGLRVAEDLSNLDEVVRVAKEGLGL